MNTLSTLDISHIDRRIPPLHSVNCLSECSTSLKYLSILSTHSIIDPFDTILNSIEALDLDLYELTSGLGEIISSYFPNLVTLKLIGYLHENVNITLISSRFQNVIFDTGGLYLNNSPRHSFSFKYQNEAIIQYFNNNNGKVTPAEYDDIQNLPITSVTSFAEEELVISRNIKVIPIR